MQAVILAAGMGRRLGDLTKNNTKCMLPVNGRTLIERSLSSLSRLGLTRVVIVVGYEGQNVVDLIGNNFNGVPIVYVWNKDYEKTNNIYSLHLAEEYLQQDDTLLLESDLIYEDAILSRLLDDPRPDLAVVSKYESWMDGTVVTINDNDEITRFIPKKYFSYEEIGEYHKTVNIYKFSKQFLCSSYLPFLRAYSSAMGNNEYYEQVLRVILTLEQQTLKALRLGKERWYEIDDIQDLNNAETIFQEPSKRYESMVGRWGGFWRFPGIKDYCFLVNPYFPQPVMIEEIKAYFGDLISEYPSGQAVQRLLAGKMYGCNASNILVGNGAAELINAASQALTGEVGFVAPTFQEYPNRIPQERRKLLFPLRNTGTFNYTIGDLKVFCRDVDAFILINPDNPSGHYICIDDLRDLAGWFEKNGKRLIVDESFLDFSDENTKATLISDEIFRTYPSLVVVRSIGKSYGVPGARLGVIASGDKNFLSQVQSRLSIWNIGSFGEFFLQIFGKYEKQYASACEQIRAERDRLRGRLMKMDFLKVFPSQANYFLCEVIGNMSARDLAVDLLDKHGILIKDCSGKEGFEGGQYIRIAVRDAADNAHLCNSLSCYCSKSSGENS